MPAGPSLHIGGSGGMWKAILKVAEKNLKKTEATAVQETIIIVEWRCVKQMNNLENI